MLFAQIEFVQNEVLEDRQQSPIFSFMHDRQRKKHPKKEETFEKEQIQKTIKKVKLTYL
jgi:hypothetical protein